MELLNKSHTGDMTLRDGMRERRRREWYDCEGWSSTFRRKMRPRRGMQGPNYEVPASPPLPIPLRGALVPRSVAPLLHSLGIVDQARTCVVRLVIIPILPATRPTEDLFTGSLWKQLNQRLGKMDDVIIPCLDHFSITYS
jgi:hypothetical protein